MKKVLAIVLVLVMVIGLAACGNGGNTTPANNGNESKSEIAGTYKIKVWCPDAAVELTKKQIDDFNKTSYACLRGYSLKGRQFYNQNERFDLCNS